MRECVHARARAYVRACVRVSVVSVTVKHPVLPPSAVDRRSRNPLYYLFFYLVLIRMPYESYGKLRFRFPSCMCDIFRALINSPSLLTTK